MITYSHETMDDLYEILVRETRKCGQLITPRGKLCTELRPASFTLTNPRRSLYRGHSRKLNYRFWAIETLQYLAGWGNEIQHAELLLKVNSNLAFAINPETSMFDGAYGPRIEASLRRVVSQLREDPDTRQAVVSIWSPAFPVPTNSRDVPCTVMLHFYRDPVYREQALGLTVYMRSNDLNWGTPYDVAAFCALQCILADCLNWKVADYHHIAGSLHFYQETPPQVLPHAEEVWGYGWQEMPQHGYQCLTTLQGDAGRFLSNLSRHLLNLHKEPQDWRMPNMEANSFWHAWAELIRTNGR